MTSENGTNVRLQKVVFAATCQWRASLAPNQRGIGPTRVIIIAVGFVIVVQVVEGTQSEKLRLWDFQNGNWL